MEARACVRYLVQHPQPSYLRLGKAGESNFHDQVPELGPGCWLKVAAGSAPGDPVLLSTGATLALAMRRRGEIAHSGHAVYSMPLWGMAVKAMQADQVRRHSAVHTLEDHLLDGGFGSWLMESLASEPNLRARLSTSALDPMICGQVGSQSTLNRHGGLG